MSLTHRQSQILKAIIEEYIASAEPVASVELVERRRLPVSGATVRNVMADLVNLGYLQMLHVSSGRTPTDMAYRYYINDLMLEDEISVLDEVALKQKVWNSRYELEKLLRSAAQALSDASGCLGIALTSDGYYAFSGVGKILDIPEFYEIEVTKSVLRFIDDYELTLSILQKAHANSRSTSVLIGREIGLASMEPVSIVSALTKVADRNCYIGIIGPARTEYGKLIPIIKYMSALLEETGDSL
jgi:transcriptional regulator of heat shock response